MLSSCIRRAHRQLPTVCRFYTSRAHPKPIPELGICEALDIVLADAHRRMKRKEGKLKRVRTPEEKKRKGPFDETIELALNLNLDPRKPGQALRGSVSLPNGTGKKINCIVFTSDEELQKKALEAGALQAGGAELIEQIASGAVAVEGFERSLGTPEIMPTVTKKLARLLGPRGLMPNAKVGTLLAKDELLVALETQLSGKEIFYRTEKEGIVHVPVGKGSFEPSKLLENIGEVMKEVFLVKPETFGKGKKAKAGGKGAKYLLRASLSSTHGKGFRLELRTVDPGSPHFLKPDGKQNTNTEEVSSVAS